MARLTKPSPHCPDHGLPSKRSDCRGCNAAYMRMYLWRRRQTEPDRELWRRAKKRAMACGIAFSLPEGSIVIPPTCPVLGIPLFLSGKRSANSPSLDRIKPSLGYVPGNVRVISDCANRLKGDRDMDRLVELSNLSDSGLQSQYKLLVEYLEREELLSDVLSKATSKQSGWQQWLVIYDFLEKIFSRGILTIGEASSNENDAVSSLANDLRRANDRVPTDSDKHIEARNLCE